MATFKTITIEYAYTFNLGNYSNVRPAVALTVELADGDNVVETVKALQTEARAYVEGEIDRALIRHDQRPHFMPPIIDETVGDEPPF